MYMKMIIIFERKFADVMVFINLIINIYVIDEGAVWRPTVKEIS